MSHQPPTPKAMDFAAANDWPGYFAAVAGKPPRDTLLKALALFDAETTVPPSPTRLAVDLGCGEGRDTLELLRRGWRTVALDGHPEGVRRLRDHVPPQQAALLIDARVATFADARWPACDLLNSSFALPFCDPELFPELWQRITASLSAGGRFCGQLFGNHDTWALSRRTLGHTRADVDRLFHRFTFDMLNEEEKDDTTTLGEPKHWHVFHIVATKR